MSVILNRISDRLLPLSLSCWPVNLCAASDDPGSESQAVGTVDMLRTTTARAQVALLMVVCTENPKSDDSGDEVHPGWRLN